MCVVMITARSGVANELTRLQISLRVEGSSPVVGLQNEDKDEFEELRLRETIMSSRIFKPLQNCKNSLIEEQHVGRSKQRYSN